LRVQRRQQGRQLKYDERQPRAATEGSAEVLSIDTYRLDRLAILYETGQFTETVGDLAGYILQGNPQTINARLQGTIERIIIYPGPLRANHN